ncbi:MAG: hypothetical protein E6K41_01375 [Gammaproteobacteria bacterium]|nr:MAG: hypothetical protein E6K41_01375 [Gammaproteobacteria bacterium]TLZ53842.1 MAG: hypothetical protein E6K22_06855 [Gammaproteobacteria bacterium]
MKHIRGAVALISAALLFASGGCVSTRTTQIDSRTSDWRGKSVALTNRPPAGFMPTTAGKMMFGLIGVGAAVEAGRKMVAENSLEDPAPIVGRALQEASAAQYGTVAATSPPASIDETDVTRLAQAARGADLLFDVQVTGWGFLYKPNLTHYFVNLGVKLRVIDVPKKTLVAEGFCMRSDKDAKGLPTYDQLLAEHGALLKSKLKADTDACIEEFKQKVLNIPASAT